MFRYSGNDLKNAACYDRNGLPPYSATIHSLIGAMAMKKFEECYKCMKITNKANKKSVVVKIVDKCAGMWSRTPFFLTLYGGPRLSKKKYFIF